MAQILGDITADLITFLNFSMQLTETATGDNFKTAMKLLVKDMSVAKLLAKSRSIATVSGDHTLAKADDYLRVINLTPTKADGTRYQPMSPLSGGYTRWKELRDFSSVTGVPEWYCEDQEGNYCIWKPANGVYAIEDVYYAIHSTATDFEKTLTFLNVCENAIKYGLAYFFGLSLRRDDDVARWGILYETEKLTLKTFIQTSPAIVGI